MTMKKLSILLLVSTMVVSSVYATDDSLEAGWAKFKNVKPPGVSTTKQVCDSLSLAAKKASTAAVQMLPDSAQVASSVKEAGIAVEDTLAAVAHVTTRRTGSEAFEELNQDPTAVDITATGW